MSTHIPLRLARIPAQPLRRQCLFQRARTAPALRHFSASTPRPFSATLAASKKQKDPGYRLEDRALQKASAKAFTNPAPSVHMGRMRKQAGAIAEDIGLVQNTVVCAPLSQLPPVYQRQFWSYLWTLLRSKFTALWTRVLYRQCLQKEGLSRYIPVDIGKNKQLASRAKELYESVHKGFASGQINVLNKLCLPPLAEHFTDRIAAGSSIKMHWAVKNWKSARVVSHRAASMGDEHPDTCFRQVIVRLESEQQTRITPKATSRAVTKSHKAEWVPDNVRGGSMSKESNQTAGQVEQTENVVDYFVMQKRVVLGQPEEWKAWGFTTVSTPATLEADEEYWRKAMEFQSANAA